MKWTTCSAGILAGLAAVWSLAGAPALPAPGGDPAALSRGWGRLVAFGIVASVDQTQGTALVAIAGTGRLETFLGGEAWSLRTLSGTHQVRLLPATLVLDSGERPATPASVRAGVPVAVWAAVRPDAVILALTVKLTSPPAAPASAHADVEGPAASGVVLRRSGPMLTLLTDSGVRRSVVLTAATGVRDHGQSLAVSTLAPFDVLRVDGVVNSDGSLAATRCVVEFSASSAIQVSGPVELNVAELGGFVVGGTLVSTSAETYVLHNEARVPFSQLNHALTVDVYGTPIAEGGTPVGLHAHVVVVR
jgi:hypothetical protein